MSPDAGTLPWGDIQGVILRSYGFPVVRHFVLRFRSSGAARLLQRLIDGSDPTISSAADWGAARPDYRLQIGFTYAGLEALGLPDESLAAFRRDGHRAFAAGAVARAASIGDVGPSAPENWIGRLNEARSVHALISLHVADPSRVEDQTARLRSLWGSEAEELSAHTARELPDRNMHFGFRDGVAQPRIRGGPIPASPSRFECEPGLFLLGRPVPSAELAMPVPDPPVFGRDGSFAAFRILEQNVAGFETFLANSAAAAGRTAEWIAARLCGRWRNGVPLALSPETPAPATPIPDADLDGYDYADDPAGLRTPLGSHIRRAFPREDDITGGIGAGLRHRIIRRGMPYGPPFDPANPDTVKRGLLGVFIGASIEQQFEFVSREWLNKGGFNGLMPSDSRDPFASLATPPGSMVIPLNGSPALRLPGFGPFVTTRGSAYLFMPSLPALRHIAEREQP